MGRYSIDIALKQSNTSLSYDYEGPEKNPSDVLRKLFSNGSPGEWVLLESEDRNSQMYICPSEIAALNISKKW